VITVSLLVNTRELANKCRDSWMLYFVLYSVVLCLYIYIFLFREEFYCLFRKFKVHCTVGFCLLTSQTL
jgi:hypothetical protein